MPHTDKLVWNFSTMWELLNVNRNYKLISSSMINIEVKLIYSAEFIVTNSSHQDRADQQQEQQRSNLHCVSYPSSMFCRTTLSVIWETI